MIVQFHSTSIPPIITGLGGARLASLPPDGVGELQSLVLIGLESIGVRFGLIVGQISLKLDKSWTFQVIFHYTFTWRTKLY